MDDSDSKVGFSCLTILLLFGIFIFFFVIFIQSTGPIIETGPAEEYPIDLRIKIHSHPIEETAATEEKIVFAKREETIHSGPNMAYEILRTTQQYEALPYVLKKWGYYKLVLDEFEEAWVDKRDVYTHMQMQIISTAVLEVITIDEEYGYLKGTVKNISNEIIENVQVMVDFSTYNGDYIKSGMAPITDTPLMPGKTSSFEIIVPPDQGVFSFVLRFKTLEGTLLPAYKETSFN